MSSRSLSQFAILGLLLAGGLGLSARYSARLSDRTALEDSLWSLTYDVSFRASQEDAALYLALPEPSDHLRVEEEEFIAPRLSTDVRRLVPSGTRVLVLQPSQFGSDVLHATAEFTIRLRPRGGWGEEPLMNLAGDSKAWFLRPQPTVAPKSNPEIRALVSRARTETNSPEELLQWVFDYCSRHLKPAPAGDGDDVLGALEDQDATPLARARTMVTLCRAADYPARLVTGFELRQRNKLRPHTWVEVFRDARWQPFDPEYGYARHLPDNFVAARSGGDQVVFTPAKSPPPEDVQVSYSLVRLGPGESVLKRDDRRPSQMFDLTRLPVEMHEVLSLLLLLPLGALITSFFRNIVGIPTFGTFAPALFAVSFIYADWGSGLIILTVVFLAGSLGRALVGRLQLLMVPRLSIILTTIILCVVVGVSSLDYLGVTPSANAVLLPLVIVTVLIERFYVTVEEDGGAFAAQLAAGTVLVSAVCYLVLGWDDIGKAILVYPEAHLITIALFIAIGRYAGYRIVELWRFRDLVQRD